MRVMRCINNFNSLVQVSRNSGIGTRPIRELPVDFAGYYACHPAIFSAGALLRSGRVGEPGAQHGCRRLAALRKRCSASHLRPALISVI